MTSFITINHPAGLITITRPEEMDPEKIINILTEIAKGGQNA